MGSQSRGWKQGYVHGSNWCYENAIIIRTSHHNKFVSNRTQSVVITKVSNRWTYLEAQNSCWAFHREIALCPEPHPLMRKRVWRLLSASWRCWISSLGSEQTNEVALHHKDLNIENQNCWLGTTKTADLAQPKLLTWYNQEPHVTRKSVWTPDPPSALARGSVHYGNTLAH